MAVLAAPALDSLVQDISLQIANGLPGVLERFIASGIDPSKGFRLDCVLRCPEASHQESSETIVSLDIRNNFHSTSLLESDARTDTNGYDQEKENATPQEHAASTLLPASRRTGPASRNDNDAPMPEKRRATGGLTIGSSQSGSSAAAISRRLESDGRVFPKRRKRQPDNPSLQPSTLDKFISGVWDNIFSSVRVDPDELIQEWQAIESSGQPKLLLDIDSEVAMRRDSAFGRMSVLARKISQTSRTCRSLEVIVQARWIEAFDERIAELAPEMTKEQARKNVLSQACLDFSWSEKELRNKMAVWRGYHDIRTFGGWAPLVFAGMGLYRFCKYRISFTESTFAILRALRHRFEVAADTLHPRWRSLLVIVGQPTQRKYTGHPHDWVVCGPEDEAIPLSTTYHQWDSDFSYIHLDESVIDEDAWGLFDPRTVLSAADANSYTCQTCGQHQSDDPRRNECVCFPSLYGGAKFGFIPVQVFRTPNGKNNGLLACCTLERGAAIAEFVGRITSGLENKDVMFGETDRAAYQIWQGREGNHSRFVNHSCQPNSQFERFVWLGIQRIVLVSKGIEAGEEITIDYSDTYWKHLDKICLCNEAKCRYRNRAERLLAPPES